MPAARSGRPPTRTARARKAPSSSGRRGSSPTRWARTTARGPRSCSAPRRRATSRGATCSASRACGFRRAGRARGRLPAPRAPRLGAALAQLDGRSRAARGPARGPRFPRGRAGRSLRSDGRGSLAGRGARAPRGAGGALRRPGQRRVLPHSVRRRGAARAREAWLRRRGADRQLGRGAHLAAARGHHRRGALARGRGARPALLRRPAGGSAGRAGRDAAGGRLRAGRGEGDRAGAAAGRRRRTAARRAPHALLAALRARARRGRRHRPGAGAGPAGPARPADGVRLRPRRVPAPRDSAGRAGQAARLTFDARSLRAVLPQRMRLARLWVLAALCWTLGACKKTSRPHTVGLALDVGGRGDQSFNEGALRGLEAMAAGLRYTPRGYEPLPDGEYRKLLGPLAVPHLGIPPPLVLQGKAQEDYEPNLQLLIDQGAELVVAVGFMMEPATRKVARDNPRAKFLLIDSPVLDDAGKPTTLPNVRAVVFREHEGSFRAGVRAVNPAAARDVLVAYTGSFDDERKGVEVGQDLYRRGCDIVFHGAGLDGLGVIKAAQQAGRWVIGVDSDQGHVAPRNVLTSMIKHADLAVYHAVRDAVNGSFTGGDVVLGLAEGGVGLAPLGGDADPAVTAAARAAAMKDVEILRAAVVSGRIAVPATPQELARFDPPTPEALGLAAARGP